MATKAPAKPISLGSLDALRKKLDQKYGTGTVVNLTGGAYEPVDSIPTGCVQVDAALGVGGFPRGRLIELFGPESSGKTSLCLNAIRGAQAKGLAVCFMDYEHSFDPFYAELFGVNISSDNFLLIQPMSLESGMQAMEMALQNDLFGLVVVDSLAAMMTAQELSGELGDVTVGSQARAMSSALKRLVPTISRSQAAVVFINHMREVIGGFNPTGQTRYTTPGGRALKFYASVRIELKMLKGTKTRVTNPVSGEREDQTTIQHIRAVIIKNKVAPPWRYCSFHMKTGLGIVDAIAVLEVLESKGTVSRAGSRYILPRENAESQPANLGGLEATLEWLDEHPEFYSKLRRVAAGELRNRLKINSPHLSSGISAQTTTSGHDTIDEDELDIEAAPRMEVGIPGKDGAVSVSFGLAEGMDAEDESEDAALSGDEAESLIEDAE